MNKQRLIDQLKTDEGYVLTVYRDSLGLPTVGIGHLVLASDNLTLGDTISDGKALELFEKDLASAIDSCDALTDDFDALPDEVQEVMINMAFNLGAKRFAGFVYFLHAINSHNWPIAADEMVKSRWYSEVGERAKRLVERMRNIP